GRQRMLDPGEERPPRRSPPDQREAVVRDSDERRRENGKQRRIVVSVVQQTQIREQIDDLLLPEIALPVRAVRREPGLAELTLVPLGVGAGGEEQHDLARGGGARVDELTNPPSDRARLATSPVRAGLVVARLVGDQELH